MSQRLKNPRARSCCQPHAGLGRHGRGFTLVEMIAVIVLSGIIFSLGSVMLGKVFSSYALKRDVTDADWQAKVALERMTRELRAVRNATAADLAISPTQIRFVDTDGNSVCFYQNGTSLVRAGDGPGAASCGPTSPQVLADKIKPNSLAFTYWQDDGATAAAEVDVYYIAVTFNVEDGNYNYDSRYRTSVRPRNF